MFAKVHLGYREGRALPSATYGQPLYGKIISARVSSCLVLNLWPHDFPLNAKTPESRPIASLWRPQVSVFLEGMQFAVSGLERRANGQWVAQRWMVQAVSFADIQRERTAPNTRGGS